MVLPHQIIEFSDRLRADRRVQVTIGAEGGLDVLMARALTHQQDRRLEMDEQRGVGVPEIVQPDLLNAGGVAPLLHLAVEVALRVREEPVVRVQVVDCGLIGLDLLAQFVRQREHPAPALSLRVGDDLFALYALEALVHREALRLQVNVAGPEGQQLTDAEASPEEDWEACPPGEPGDVLDDGVKLIDRPEVHLGGVLFADAASGPGRIAAQAVILARIIEDRRQLR